MTGKDLLFAMGEVRDELIEEAAAAGEARPRRGGLLWVGLAAAACVAAALLLPHWLPRYLRHTETAAIQPVPAPVSDTARPGASQPDPATPRPEVLDQVITAPEAASGPMTGPAEDPPEIPAPEMIEDYELPGGEEAPDYAVNPGGVLYSPRLQAAMEAYGDGVRYRVVVEIFAEGAQIVPDGEAARAEFDRLGGLGYITSLDRYYRDGVQTAAYFTLHAALEQLQSFQANPRYGYGLWLYRERVAPVTDWEGITMHAGAFDAPAE